MFLDFTIIVLPDTQEYAANAPEIATAQGEWVADNADRLNVAFVSHVGDIVNLGGVEAEWIAMRPTFDALDLSGVTWSIAVGNHDYRRFWIDGIQTRDLEVFDQFMPLGVAPQTAGSFDGGADNTYQRFSAGGMQFLHVSYEYCPRPEVLAWVDTVIDAHPDHRVIITTHGFLSGNGSRFNGCPPDTGAGGTDQWTSTVSQHPGVFLVLCGHTLSPTGGVYRVDDGVAGNPVHQIKQNYQDQTLGGGGFLRIMRFDPDEGAVHVSTYSPWLDQWKTDPANQFTFPYEMADRLVPRRRAEPLDRLGR